MAAQDAAAESTMSPLAHLTSQSAAFGLWEVLIFAPDAQEREYIYEKKEENRLQLSLSACVHPGPDGICFRREPWKRHERSGPQRYVAEIQAGPCVPHDQTKFCHQCEAPVQQRSEERSRLYVAHDLGTSPE